jgi:predicted aspartyl protease
LSLEIQFEHVIAYHQDTPSFFLRLIGPTDQLDIPVTLDTGSQYSLVDGSHAKRIGIELLEGREIALSSLGGVVKGYLHSIVLEIEGSLFNAEVVFSLNPIPRELLGRHTLFEQTTWGLRESRREIYFSPRP